LRKGGGLRFTKDEHFASPIGNGQAVREKDSPIDANTATTYIDIEFAGSGGNFGRMGRFPPSNSGDQTAQRRSQRVIVRAEQRVVQEG